MWMAKKRSIVLYRLHQTYLKAKRRLGKGWFWLLVLIGERLVENRMVAWANTTIDSGVAVMWAWSAGFLLAFLQSPLGIVGSLLAVVIFVIVVHSYIETWTHPERIEMTDSEHERLEQAVKQIQSQVSWRKLSKLQGETISKLLRRAKGTTVDIYWVPGADDGWAYARQFLEVFERAGWSVEHRSQLLGPDAEGIIVLAETEEDEKMGRLIQEALTKAGIGASIEHEPTIGGLALVVGRKETSDGPPDVNSE